MLIVSYGFLSQASENVLKRRSPNSFSLEILAESKPFQYAGSSYVHKMFWNVLNPFRDKLVPFCCGYMVTSSNKQRSEQSCLPFMHEYLATQRVSEVQIYIIFRYGRFHAFVFKVFIVFPWGSTLRCDLKNANKQINNCLAIPHEWCHPHKSCVFASPLINNH